MRPAAMSCAAAARSRSTRSSAGAPSAARRYARAAFSAWPAHSQASAVAAREAARLGRRPSAIVVEGRSIKARRLGEGQLGDRLLRGALGVEGSALLVARAEEVRRDGLGIRVGRRLEHARELRVVRARTSAGSCATIVSRMRSWLASTISHALAQARAHEAPRCAGARRAAGRSRRRSRPRPRSTRAGAGRRRRRSRASRRASSGSRATRVARASSRARPRAGRRLARRPSRCGGRRSRRARAPRAGRGFRPTRARSRRPSPSAGVGFRLRGARRGQAARILEHRAARRQLAHLGVLGPARAQVGQEGARLRLLGPVGRHEQHRRRRGRPHQLDEQRGAVGVAPLDVVDEDHDALPLRERRDELAQRAERELPDDLRVARRRSAGRSSMPGTRRSTGKTCASAPIASGKRQGSPRVCMSIRCRLSASTTLSTAL